jgi:hypothetical protein
VRFSFSFFAAVKQDLEPRLCYGILSGSLEVIDALLVAGADPSFVAHAKNVNPPHPLALTMHARRRARCEDSRTAHCFRGHLIDGRRLFIHQKGLNIPAWYCFWLVFLVVSTIEAGDHAMVSPLPAHGAKLSYLPGIFPGQTRSGMENPLL